MTTKSPAPSDIADKFMLRLPEGMRDQLKDAAAANNRSLNAEIVQRLRTSLDAAAFNFTDVPVGSPVALSADDYEALVRGIHQIKKALNVEE